MKLFILAGASALLGLSANMCNKKPQDKTYRGRLEVKALCMNYTISILDENVDTSLVVTNWRDESSGKTFKNAFGLESRCTFPASIKEGDEFYFVIDSSAVQNCAVCMAYYPTPSKKLSIKVVEK